MPKSFLPTNEQLSNVDPWLAPYHDRIQQRLAYTASFATRVLSSTSIADFALGHLYFGLHLADDGWVFREWAPNASKIYVTGSFSDWTDDESFAMQQTENGHWKINLPKNTLKHGDHYKLHIYWNGGDGYRIPAWANYVVQDSETNVFDAAVWNPEVPYVWQDVDFSPADEPPIIYEAHIGMSSEKEAVSTYGEFTHDVIPRIKAAGYNTIQLMAIAEHPYYGSFGYHVSSFFAPSSRFGTPDELRRLVDTAHQAGLRVIMDLVHSHAVKNELDGISRFDGSSDQYFHAGDRGNHDQWDSRVFDYGKPDVAHFLLSNCRYWLDEFHMDGYRFDGLTSMLYTHHGMATAFNSYDMYFQDIDSDAAAYLTLANQLIHDVKPRALTVAEDMSGMPGLAAPITIGGIGFDYRLSMGVPDLWIKYVKDIPDEQWQVSQLFNELMQHRPEEQTISYAESHDQALVGDKTLLFRLIDKDMYDHMLIDDKNNVVDRGIALHKMIRLLTASLHHGGYLNFMGNEFGHPEWIDFPRLENNWSYKYARRQWKLSDDPKLKYHFLAAFDKAMVDIVRDVSSEPGYVLTHDDDHVISYARGDLLFVYNFHPTKSFESYGFAAATGSYKIILSSDDVRFGGFDRIDTGLNYTTNGDGQLQLYLPVRTCLVLQRQ